MEELAALEFDQIGRLDWDGTSGMYRVVPFADISALIQGIQGLDTVPHASSIHFRSP
jgi:hypothetical protein